VKLLILGGTVFLGRHVVHAALERGHEVTLFNRGKSNPDVFPDVETIRGDRDGGLDVLGDRTWDAVVDPSGYVPRVVRASAEALSGRVGHYTFVSSISVYPDFGGRNPESSPVGTLADESVETVDGETYGPLKALCEAAAEAVFPGRTLNVRAGLIVGSHDPSDRFTYWPHRIAEGGEVLAPGDPAATVQFVDVRDLAAWMVTGAETGTAGVFNATGPEAPLTMDELLTTTVHVADSGAELVWVDPAFLAEHEVGPWMELPLWIPDVNARTDCSKAIAAGLTFRPREDTVRDTITWAREERPERPWRAGLSRDREKELLAAWRKTR
jgi:2'-hydroxyisoflavone reductase